MPEQDDGEPSAPLPNPKLLDLTEQDYLDWKHHPVTKLVRQYLDDYSRSLRRGHEDLWLNAPGGHAVDPVLAAEMKGRVLTLAEMRALTFLNIADFYQTGEQDTDAAAVD